MKSPPYFPLYTRDFIHSCRTSSMTADEVGALAMVMCAQWEAMGPLASDPKRFAAYTGWDIRVAKRLLTRLIEIEKIKATERGIESARMSEEIKKYIAKVRGAEAREARRRAGGDKQVADEKRETSSGFVPDLSEKFGTSFPELFKKDNKVNDPPSRDAPLPEPASEPYSKKVTPSSPSGSSGGLEEAKASKLAVRRAQVRACIEQYNHDARKHGWTVCQAVTEARISRMLKRLDEIGGPEQFFIALKQIPTIPFLMGLIPARDGGAPFKLDIDRLLSTGSNMGDVLAKLIDKASDAPDLIGPGGERWGFWEPNLEKLRTLSADYWRKRFDDVKPNGSWPWWLFGPPPGHPDCYVHPDVIGERDLLAKYGKDAANQRNVANQTYRNETRSA
ncbi:MAG: DUF1376 domain-containing protein [Proteobacteria bacterium]|nr:DUF1376 domain-containing protein [Pseudomonadota bacterium]